MALGKLLIVGTGGQGHVVLDSAKGQYESIAFLTTDLETKPIKGHEILFEQYVSEVYILRNFDEIVIAIGNNARRLQISLEYEKKGMKLATIVHPTAVISETAKIGPGTVVFANAVINSGAKVGKACIINTGVIIEHDCILEDGVHISPNAVMGGTCTVGEKTWVCVGCSIANNIHIGKNCVIGAGAAVVKDVPDNVMAAGVPVVVKKKI
jgi:sugar O-acyltransferase (sialic acid O-acetyltransferase NeuD family)